MISVCRGNDFNILIPIRRFEVVEGQMVPKIYDLHNAKELNVRIVGGYGSASDAQWSLDDEGRLLLNVRTSAMSVGVYGVEATVLTDDDVEMRFFDSKVFRLVNETKDADRAFAPSEFYECMANVIIPQR